MTVILALDLGTTTGWALRSEGGQVSSGTLCFKPKRFEGGGMRYVRFRNALAEFEKQGVGQVAFEEVRRHLGVDAAHIYGGLMATLEAWAEHREIPYQGIPVGTWKKSLTGKGNASKTEVINAVAELGHTPADDNEADAIGILLHVIGVST